MAEKPSSKKLAAAPAAAKAAPAASAAKAAPAPIAKPVAPPAQAAAPRAAAPAAPTAQGKGKVDAKERHRLVAEAAYYRALKRGFAPGHEVQDWIAAEKEVDARLAKG